MMAQSERIEKDLRSFFESEIGTSARPASTSALEY
jgi:hypothetical protein